MPVQPSRAQREAVPAHAPVQVLHPRRRLRISLRASNILVTLHCSFAIASFLVAAAASAQINTTVSVVSDYRYRGVSLSDGDAVPQINVEYDNAHDWYVGAFASPIELDRDRDRNQGKSTQLLTYAGYSRRVTSGWSWEAGAASSIFLQAANYNYGEVFVGVHFDHVNGRLYFSPNYYGLDQRTAYLEINGAYPIGERLQLLGHAGMLRYLSNAGDFYPPAKQRVDARLGASARFGDWSVQLAWVAVQKTHVLYQRDENARSSGCVLSASYSF